MFKKILSNADLDDVKKKIFTYETRKAKAFPKIIWKEVIR